ncbi:MAG: hypothetical protein EPO27_10475 [Betaproteobacteria bacterium]|nr:MAG: hypothetical protein EPO27_10475 [Betaproteobacteria bacterium]
MKAAFSRLAQFLSAIAAGSAPSPYVSRGKGRGTGINRTFAIQHLENGRMYARPIDRSKYMPHQGKRECARRAARAANPEAA